MNIAICEDDKITSLKIAEDIKSVFAESNIDCTVDVFDYANTFEHSGKKYDLVFLDCHLPDKNGIDIGRSMREKGDDAVLIFVTAYEEYVYDSFEVNPFRYILKPVDKAVLRKTINSFIDYYEKDAFVEVLTARKSFIIKLDEIMYIESNDKKCLIRMINRLIDSTKSVADYENEITSPSFFRTHRRYLLNMKYIADINKNIVTLVNGERVEVSRRNMGAFNKAYINYLKYSARNGK